MTEAVTYAFADGEADVCGVARLGLADGTASGLVVIFRGGEPVAVHAEGTGEAGGADVETVAAGGLHAEALDGGERWRARFDGDVPFDLEFSPLAPAVELAGDAPAAQAGGMAGADWFCSVAGEVGGAAFAGLGQRGRSWGEPDWERLAVARTLSAWLDAEHAITAVGVRPATGRTHADEATAAFVFDGDREEDPVRPVADPRISTAYDAEGRQRRAGLELYVDPDDAFPRRAAGELAAGTTLDLGRLRLDCAFFRWRMEGRSGVGRYDVLRRVG